MNIHQIKSTYAIFLKFSVLSILFTTTLTINNASASLTDHLIFKPNQTPFADCPLADQQGFQKISKHLQIEGKDELVRFYFKDNPSPRILVIDFHGVEGRACDRLPYLTKLYYGQGRIAADIALAVVEYPGYAGDSISPSEERILANTKALLAFISQINTAQSPVVLYGESLGTAVATYAASISSIFSTSSPNTNSNTGPSALNNIAGVILQSPFTSIVEVAKHHYPYLPVGLFISSKFNAYQWAANVTVPVIGLHGTSDSFIPIAIGKQQMSYFTRSSKTVWVEVPGAEHDTIFNSPLYWEKVEEFFLLLNFSIY
ncbi:MAG: hypothetical protein HQK53_15235 [Oligoflexia bacterium]|nr:hypothetical protein [Oligoflexia bacterium]